MSRLATTFARLRNQKGTEKEPALVAYVTAGDPDFETSCEIVRGISRGGADVIELGVPFSDPIADGPVIQRASERSLAAGGSLSRTLDIVHAIRAEIDTPIVLFTYVNPVLRMGAEAFASRAAAEGVDGVLMLDMPIEESRSMHSTLAAARLDQIFLVSPTTSEERLGVAAELGSGFLYAISRLGVTGARDAVAGTARPVVEAVRKVTTLPVALGFGISRPEHVRQACEYADAAVVGSALVQVIAEAPRDRAALEAERFTRWLKSRMHQGLS